MNRNLNRRIHPIAEADGLSPKKPRKTNRKTIARECTRVKPVHQTINDSTNNVVE